MTTAVDDALLAGLAGEALAAIGHAPVGVGHAGSYPWARGGVVPAPPAVPVASMALPLAAAPLEGVAGAVPLALGQPAGVPVLPLAVPTPPSTPAVTPAPATAAVAAAHDAGYYFLAAPPPMASAPRGFDPSALVAPPSLLAAGLPEAGAIPTAPVAPPALGGYHPPALGGYHLPALGGHHPPAPAAARFDVHRVRDDFPILRERINGRPLIWLDSAATTQKPRAVIDRLRHFYEHENSNVHRGAHTLAARATDAYEEARATVQRFLGAGSSREIVFVRGTTEAINLVAQTLGRTRLGPGDEIVLTTLEHHSNIVPWQIVAEERGARLRVVPVTDRGEVLIGDYRATLGPRTRLVAATHVSNALGTVLPVAEMIAIAHRAGIPVLIDGAQAAAHMPIDVRALDADFYTISGHKLFGPTGIGALYGKAELLESLPPWQGGGSMIDRVTFERSTFAPLPARLEAGTGSLAPAVGLGAALGYLLGLGMAPIERHEHELLLHGTELLSRIRGVRLIGTAPHKASILGFVVDGFDPVQIGQCLDREGIAVRAGHHCAQPSLARFGLTSSVRPSLALYNTHEELEHLARVLRAIIGRGP